MLSISTGHLKIEQTSSTYLFESELMTIFSSLSKTEVFSVPFLFEAVGLRKMPSFLYQYVVHLLFAPLRLQGDVYGICSWVHFIDDHKELYLQPHSSTCLYCSLLKNGRLHVLNLVLYEKSFLITSVDPSVVQTLKYFSLFFFHFFSIINAIEQQPYTNFKYIFDELIKQL